MAVIPVSLIAAVFSTSWLAFPHALWSPQSGLLLVPFVVFGCATGWGHGTRYLTS